MSRVEKQAAKTMQKQYLAIKILDNVHSIFWPVSFSSTITMNEWILLLPFYSLVISSNVRNIL